MSATECLFVSETFVALEIQFDVIFIEIDERNDETSENALSTIHGSIRYNVALDTWVSFQIENRHVIVCSRYVIWNFRFPLNSSLRFATDILNFMKLSISLFCMLIFLVRFIWLAELSHLKNANNVLYPFWMATIAEFYPTCSCNRKVNRSKKSSCVKLARQFLNYSPFNVNNLRMCLSTIRCRRKLQAKNDEKNPSTQSQAMVSDEFGNEESAFEITGTMPYFISCT